MLMLSHVLFGSVTQRASDCVRSSLRDDWSRTWRVRAWRNFAQLLARGHAVHVYVVRHHDTRCRCRRPTGSGTACYSHRKRSCTDTDISPRSMAARYCRRCRPYAAIGRTLLTTAPMIAVVLATFASRAAAASVITLLLRGQRTSARSIKPISAGSAL